jgi:hypothetical protein
LAGSEKENYRRRRRPNAANVCQRLVQQLGKKKTPVLVPVVVPAALPLFGHQKDSRHEQSAAAVLQFLNKVRGINDVTLLRYGVGMATEKFLNEAGDWEDKLCVTFPWMKAKDNSQSVSADENLPMEIIRLKYRSTRF